MEPAYKKFGIPPLAVIWTQHYFSITHLVFTVYYWTLYVELKQAAEYYILMTVMYFSVTTGEEPFSVPLSSARSGNAADERVPGFVTPV